MLRKDHRHRKSTKCVDYVWPAEGDENVFLDNTLSLASPPSGCGFIHNYNINIIAVSIQLKKKIGNCNTLFFYPVSSHFLVLFLMAYSDFHHTIRIKVVCGIQFLICRDITLDEAHFHVFFIEHVTLFCAVFRASDYFLS